MNKILIENIIILFIFFIIVISPRNKNAKNFFLIIKIKRTRRDSKC